MTGDDYDLFGSLWDESSDHKIDPTDEVRLGYAGYVRDPLTGLLLARHRWYGASATAAHQEVTPWTLRKAIREASFEPVERDTLYRRVKRDGKKWRVE